MEARRIRMLSVATAEFVTHGFANANVARIAREAGVSNKTIYARYPTKEALLLGVIAEITAPTRGLVLIGMSPDCGNPEHVLEAFGIRIAARWTAPLEVGLYRLVLAESHRFPALADILRQQMEALRRPLVDYLLEQIASGRLAIPDIDAAVLQFGQLVYGAVRERAVLGDTPTPEETATIVHGGVALFLAGYAR